MGWSTELFCNISYSRESFNNKWEVESKIEGLDKEIKTCRETLRDLAIMTEPSKFVDGDDTNPYLYVTGLFENNMELLEEYLVTRWELQLLLDNWDNCHNKEGLAIEPPKGIEYDTAFLTGDFVRTDKHPDLQ